MLPQNAVRTASSNPLSKARTAALSVMLFSRLSFLETIAMMRASLLSSSLAYRAGAASLPEWPETYNSPLQGAPELRLRSAPFPQYAIHSARPVQAVTVQQYRNQM